MLVERFLQIAVCVTVILSATLLGMGQNEPSLPVMVGFFTMLALLMTDIYKIFSLNRIFQNLVTLAAMFIAIGHFSVRFKGMDQVVAIANLLVYLEIILLFRRKDVHTYWQLILLSFLQVVVAAAFPQTFTFGVLLVLYLMLMLITVALLSAMKRQLRTVRGVRDEPEMPFWQTPRQEETEAEKSNARVAHEQEKRQILKFEWLRRLVGIGMCSVLIGLMVFFLTPRRGEAFSYQTPGAGQASTGFSDTVKLGHLGTLLQDRKEALRVSLSRFDSTGVPDSENFNENYTSLPRTELAVQQVPVTLYLRGTVLSHYEDGEWKIKKVTGLPLSNPTLLGQDASSQNPQILFAPPPGTRLETLTAAEFSCDVLRQRELFVLSPFYMPRMARDSTIRYDAERKVLFWGKPIRDYTLLTQAIYRNQQASLIPCEEELGQWTYLQLPKTKRPDGTWRSSIPTVEALAQQWHSQLDDPGEEYTTYEVAQHFARQFHVAEDFRYSLTGQVRDPDMDPCEDFMRNNRVGHCEYFATALALMLRAEEIPARVVVGFSTSEFISPGNFYVVRNSDAHAWVEAWIPREDIPDYVIQDSPWPESLWENGGWLRLDPTPDAEEYVNPVAKALDSAGGWLDWYEVLWNTYVIKMDASRQMQSVYDPIRKFGMDVWYSITRNPDVIRWWKDFRRWIGSTRGRVEAGGGVILLILAVFGWRKWRAWRKITRTEAARVLGSVAGVRRKKSWFGWTRQENPVDFYLRFETLLRKKGITRGQAQTSRELAKMAEETLAPEVLPPEIVAKIVETYYRIRFGHQTPSEETLGEMRGWVETLSRGA